MINTNFQGGLNWDDHKDIIPSTDYVYAESLVSRDGKQITFKNNESVRKEFIEFEDTIIGTFYIEELDYYVIFIANGSIYKVDKSGKKTLIIKDSEFGCNWNFSKCDYIRAEFKSFGPCSETYAYFISNSTAYRINITELLDPERKAALKESFLSDCGNKDCSYFQLFDKECIPVMDIRIENEETLTGITAGAYQFSYKIAKRSGADLNYSTPTHPVNIGSENNISGEPGFGEISIDIKDLPKDYDLITLVVIKTVNSNTTARIIGTFNYSGTSFSYTYRGSDEGDSLSFNELLERNLTYISPNDLIQKDGRLWLFRIRDRFNPDLQWLVDNIKVKWLAIKVSHEDAKRNNLKSVSRGETKAYGIKYNGKHGISTPVFHISACNNASALNTKADDNINIPFEGFDYEDIIDLRASFESQINETRDNEIDPQKLIDAMACIDCGPAGADVDETINDSFDNAKKGLHDIINTINGEDEPYDPSKSIKDYVNEAYKSVNKIIAKREQAEKQKLSDFRTRRKNHVYTAQRTVNSEEVLDYIEDAEIINEGYTKPNKEQDILYPDIKNCEGEFIYGAKACTNVCHHQYPWTNEVPHFIADNSSVPSKDIVDNDLYNQQYMIMLGTRFIDIPLPTEEQLGFELCEKNPFTIVEVPLNNNNKTIIDRGMVTNNHVSSYQGKKYVYKRPAVNSLARVSRYIDIEGSRLQTGGVVTDENGHYHHSYYSNTSLSKRFALVATQFVPELTLHGNGWKHNLYAEGKRLDDEFYGTRIDQRGTCQSVVLNGYYTKNLEFADLESKIYIDANSVTAPPIGADIAFMNKHNESSLWFSINFRIPLEGLQGNFDYSFIGGTLDHSSPIFDVRCIYGALYRPLDNQYGDLHSLSYIKLYEARDLQTDISIFNRDVYISPFSFRRTDFVSDKLFDGAITPDYQRYKPICGSVDFSGKFTGFYNDRKLPEDMDRRNPRNYGSLISRPTTLPGDNDLVVLGSTMTDSEFFNAEHTEVFSDIYFPGLLKTMITFTGESQVNPYLPVLGDEDSGEIVFPHLKQKAYNSHAPENNPWEDSYLNRFYIEHVQPSKWALVKRSLILTTINLLLPAGGLATFLSIENATDATASVLTTPLLIAMWFLAKYVFFNEKKLNQMFGIPDCPSAKYSNKISDNNVLQFENNFNTYNYDYSIDNRIEVFYPITNNYYTCKCDDTTNEIYYTPMQIPESHVDSYTNFKINNYVVIPASSGELMALYDWNNNFYAHTTDGIFILSYNDNMANNLAFTLLGNGDLLRIPQKIFSGIKEGHAGLQSPKAYAITPMGILFVDEEANKPYLFNGELTPFDMKMSLFFENYMNWCEDYKCETPYTFGFDPLNERVYFTKNDGSKSWTLTYDIYTKRFVSFHLYYPDFYFWDRFNSYSINGNTMFIHDNIDEYYPVVIDAVLNTASSESVNGEFRLNSLILNTQADLNTLLDRHITFDKLGIWSTRQTTGIIDLRFRDDIEEEENLIEKIKNKGNIVDLVRENGEWRVNEVFDYTHDYNKPLIIKNDCDIKRELINVDYEHLNRQDFKNKVLQANYFNLRLVYNNTTHKLYIKNVLCITDVKMR